MRTRIAGAIAASAIAAAALVACSPPNENPSDMTTKDQQQAPSSYEQAPSSESATDTTAPAENGAATEQPAM